MKSLMNEEALELLRRAGLNQYESRIYLSLLHHGSMTASDLSEISGVPRPRTYDVLLKLEKRGLVISQPGRPTRFTAADIRTAFKSLEEEKQKLAEQKISKLRQIRDRLLELALETQPKASLEESVWLLRKRDVIYARLAQLIQAASRRITICTTTKGARRKLSTHSEPLTQARQRGVDVVFVLPEWHEKIAKEIEKFGRVIVRPHNHRLAIVDDHVLLFLHPENTAPHIEMGAWIKSPYLAENLHNEIINLKPTLKS